MRRFYLRRDFVLLLLGEHDVDAPIEAMRGLFIGGCRRAFVLDPQAAQLNPFTQIVMLGEGRASTRFLVFFVDPKRKIRGWSAFADHNGGVHAA